MVSFHEKIGSKKEIYVRYLEKIILDDESYEEYLKIASTSKYKNEYCSCSQMIDYWRIEDREINGIYKTIKYNKINEESRIYHFIESKSLLISFIDEYRRLMKFDPYGVTFVTFSFKSGSSHFGCLGMGSKRPMIQNIV